MSHTTANEKRIDFRPWLVVAMPLWILVLLFWMQTEDGPSCFVIGMGFVGTILIIYWPAIRPRPGDLGLFRDDSAKPPPDKPDADA